MIHSRRTRQRMEPNEPLTLFPAMTKLVACQTCGTKISPAATVCPSCGVPRRRTKKSTWIVGGLFALIVVVAISQSIERSAKQAEQQNAEAQRIAKLTPAQKATEAETKRKQDARASATEAAWIIAQTAASSIKK